MEINLRNENKMFMLPIWSISTFFLEEGGWGALRCLSQLSIDEVEA